MWLSDRRNFLLMLSAAALSGCGFAPVYGPDGAGNALLGQVHVADPVTRDDQLLLQQLERRLGRAEAPRFTLTYKLQIEQERMAVTATNITARFNLIGSAAYELQDATTGAVLDKGDVSQFTGYSTTGTTSATLAAERDARERLAVILADQIVTRLMAAAPDLDG